MARFDYVVIGGGVVGLSIARELKRAEPQCSALLLEKERSCGEHASGRNSGVLHAGFYYSADSLKAKFTRQGNVALSAYCEAKGIPLNRCGKLVVANGPEDLATMDELLRRGKANGVPLEKIPTEEAVKIEPRAKTHKYALWSPSTASVDPRLVVAAMKQDAADEGVEVREGVAYEGRRGDKIRAGGEEISAGYVVNAAGLYADKIARDFGFSRNYRILPFKGFYLYSSESSGALKTNLYPVPDIRNPFLGVHFTVTAAGKVKIGPTALPALWRKNYGGLSNFSLPEFIEVAWRELKLLGGSGFSFASLAADELRKGSRKRLVELASALAAGVRLEDYDRWGPSGIRAQLLDIRTNKLEMDFVLEGDGKSLHVLNAVSPGFTCALPFSAHVRERIAALR